MAHTPLTNRAHKAAAGDRPHSEPALAPSDGERGIVGSPSDAGNGTRVFDGVAPVEEGDGAQVGGVLGEVEELDGCALRADGQDLRAGADGGADRVGDADPPGEEERATKLSAWRKKVKSRLAFDYPLLNLLLLRDIHQNTSFPAASWKKGAYNWELSVSSM